MVEFYSNAKYFSNAFEFFLTYTPELIYLSGKGRHAFWISW